MALGHGLGRLGCFFAGCCHGRPSATAAWGVVFPIGSPSYIEHLENHLIQPGQAALPVYPTQLWEAGFEFFLFALLFLWRPYKYFHGQLFLLWMIFYPVGRAYIEHFRGDSIRGVYILSTSQYISILVACCALLLGIYMFWKKSWTSTDLSKNTVS
jgi:phosphatidylglycerol:prolipoprotein diacylglycerol transferase